MSISFQKARQNRIYQDVVEQIQAAILDGLIAAGAKLPAERELCESFQTSRGTLREALRILEQKGLIEIRLGVSGGAYVKGASGALMAENLAMLLRSNEVSLHHLEEFREDVEGRVAALAAMRIDPEDAQFLRSLLDEAKALHQQGLRRWNEFVRVDEHIHMAIARIAGNPLYDFVLRSVHDNIQQYYDRFLIAGETEMAENYHDLEKLVGAIITGLAPQADTLAREHVRRFAAYMNSKRR